VFKIHVFFEALFQKVFYLKKLKGVVFLMNPAERRKHKNQNGNHKANMYQTKNGQHDNTRSVVYDKNHRICHFL
jgi:hypothetical protein